MTESCVHCLSFVFPTLRKVHKTVCEKGLRQRWNKLTVMVSSAKKKEYNVSYSSEIQKGFAFKASGPTTVADYKQKYCWIICDKI